jgi:hypothetical protein
MAQRQKLSVKEKHLVIETAIAWLTKWKTDPFVQQIDYALDQGQTISSGNKPRKLAANGTFTLTVRINGGAHHKFV